MNRQASDVKRQRKTNVRRCLEATRSANLHHRMQGGDTPSLYDTHQWDTLLQSDGVSECA